MDQADNDEERVTKRLNSLCKALDLTTDQKSKAKAILQDRMNQLKPLREQMQTLQFQTDAKITEVLTDEQKEQYAEWKDPYEIRLLNWIRKKSSGK